MDKKKQKAPLIEVPVWSSSRPYQAEVFAGYVIYTSGKKLGNVRRMTSLKIDTLHEIPIPSTIWIRDEQCNRNMVQKLNACLQKQTARAFSGTTRHGNSVIVIRIGIIQHDHVDLTIRHMRQLYHKDIQNWNFDEVPETPCKIELDDGSFIDSL
jgi:hypothetical protein